MWAVSTAFTEALSSPVQTIRIKAQVLDTQFRVVASGEFFEASKKATEVQHIIIDGNVDIDVERGPRRKFQLQLMNKQAEFSPTSDWAGMFYVDRLVRLWRGLQLGTEVEWVPLGTFMIDDADVIVERNMSMVVLSGQDLWKKFNKAEVGRAKNFPVGTNIVDVVKWLAELCGVTRMTLDYMPDRANDEKLLQDKMHFEVGDKVSDKLRDIAKNWALDIYFDPLGRMIVEPDRDPTERAVVWHYEPEAGKLMISGRARYNDDSLYNVALVIGTADKDNPVYAEVKDADPTSPTRVALIGRRVQRLESDKIKTQNQANKAARKLFYSGFYTKEILTLEAICNPALEGLDAVKITEPDFLKVDHIYRLLAFSVPLSGSRQQLRVQRLIKVS